jgi:hypothetical protein
MNQFHSLAFKIDHLPWHAKATELVVVWHGARSEFTSAFLVESTWTIFSLLNFVYFAISAELLTPGTSNRVPKL